MFSSPWCSWSSGICANAHSLGEFILSPSATLRGAGLACPGRRREDEAISLYEQALAARERVLGPDHPSTLQSRSNLATAYRAAGRLDEATSLHEQTLAARERVLGPDHPDTVASRNNLAAAYQAAGRTGGS